MPRRRGIFLALSCEACGGTFAEQGEETTVNLDAINVLFRLDASSVEAHIQMAYESNDTATGFAVALPVPALPQFAIGSAPLFERVVAETAPFFDREDEFDDCDDRGSFGGGAMSSLGEHTAASGGVDPTKKTRPGPKGPRSRSRA